MVFLFRLMVLISLLAGSGCIGAFMLESKGHQLSPPARRLIYAGHKIALDKTITMGELIAQLEAEAGIEVVIEDAQPEPLLSVTVSPTKQPVTPHDLICCALSSSQYKDSYVVSRRERQLVISLDDYYRRRTYGPCR